jgi:hypothetical protein
MGFYAALIDPSWGHTVYPVFAVDSACLLALLAIALRSKHFWPLWTTACALCAVAVHLASIAQFQITPLVYQGLKDIWALAMELIMVRGIVLDNRSRRGRAMTAHKQAL